MIKYEQELLERMPNNGMKPLTRAVVTIRDAATNALALLFTANDSSATKPNPFYPDANGNISFFAPNGEYKGEAVVNGKVVASFGPFTMYDPDDDTARGKLPVTLATPPANPVENMTWINSTNGRAYSWIKDAGGAFQWVETPGTEIPHDPDVVAGLAAKVRVFVSDSPMESSQPCYAAVAVNGTRTTIDRHAFEDWSKLDTTDTGMGYCSFDAKPTLNNELDQLHLVGYQARSVYSGAGNLTQYFHGYDTAMVHNGTGTIAKAAGVYIADIGGSGPISENHAIHIETVTRGASKYAIYSDAGNAHMFGGYTGSIFTGVVQAAALNFSVDTSDKTIAYGFGSAGQVNFGSHTFYDGKNSVVLVIDKQGLTVTGAISATDMTKPGSFTVASLPAGISGFMAFCTNGRKIGEGAGAGTGVPVYYSSGAWRRFSDDSIVVA